MTGHTVHPGARVVVPARRVARNRAFLLGAGPVLGADACRLG